MDEDFSFEDALVSLHTMCRRKKNLKFRCRISKDYKTMVEIPDFCNDHLAKHIIQMMIHSDDELRDTIEEFFQRPFNFDQPPWDMALIKGYSRGDGFSMGLAEMSMFEEEQQVLDMTMKKFAFTKSLKFKLGMYFWIFWNFLSVMVILVWTFLFKRDKSKKEVFLRNGKKLTGKKQLRLLWNWDPSNETGKGLFLDTSKRVAKHFHRKMTINDFYTALLSHAISKHFRVGEKRSFVRVSIPVNVRMTPETKGPSNEFGATFVDVPVGEEMDWEERVRLTMKATAFMKKYPIQYYIFYAGKYLSWLIPNFVLKWVFNKSSSTQSIQMSNVAGSPIKIHVQGNRQKQCAFLVPLVQGTVFTIGVLSYANELSISLVADEAVENPENILELMKEKYLELVDEVIGK